METISRRNFTWSEFTRTTRHIEGYEGRTSPHGGRFVPFDLLTRDMQAGVFGSGGALTSTTHVDDKVIPFLRAKSVCARLGAEIRTGLVPSTSLPVFTSDFNAQWLGELQKAQPGDLAVGNALLSPHRISIILKASTLLGVQSSPDFDASLQQQATAKLFQAADQAALTGSGGVLPIGILNTANIQTVTFGGAPTLAKLLSFENLIGNANADGPDLGWAQSPDTRAVWKATQRASGTSTFLQDDQNCAVGYPAAMTTELNSDNAGDKTIFGNWSDLVIGLFFDGVWVTINPYTRSDYDEKIYTFHLYADCGVKRPASFCVSTDAANQ